jgi:hypothetical protein
MAITASATAEFKQIEPGLYPARCFKLIDIGTQVGEYQNKPTSRHQVIIGFEFPDELNEGGDYDGQPYSLSKFYTCSLNEKSNLYQDLVSWRGRVFSKEELEIFDLTTIVGVPCQIQVSINESKKTIIKNITELPTVKVDGKRVKITVPPAINPPVIFDLDNYLAGDDSVYKTLGEKMRAIIDKSVEVQNILKDNGEIPKKTDEDLDNNGDPMPF